jgi:hypothetical protein
LLPFHCVLLCGRSKATRANAGYVKISNLVDSATAEITGRAVIAAMLEGRAPLAEAICRSGIPFMPAFTTLLIDAL